MTAGKAALRAIIENDDRSALRDLNANLFTDEEVDHFAFVNEYYRKHGRLPGLDVMQDNSLPLGRTKQTGTVSYYMKRLFDRALWQEITPDVGSLVQAMEARDMEAAKTALTGLVSKCRDRDSGSLMTSIGREAQDLLRDATMRGQTILSVPTGYERLDWATGGLRENDFFVLAGRTNIGKSYYLLAMVMAAWKAMFRPLVITMEMGVRQLTTRMVGMESGINPRFIRDKQLGTRASRTLAETVTEFQLRPPMTFVSGHKMNGVEDVEALVHEVEPDITYIDAAYLMKLTSERGSRAGKWEKLENVMEYLQGVQVRTRRPIAITVQLGRGQSSKSSNLDGAIDKIRGTDAIAALGSVVVTAAQAEGVWAQTRRVFRLSKNREGPKEVEWWAKFEFDPMNFQQTPSEATERRNATVRSMI